MAKLCIKTDLCKPLAKKSATNSKFRDELQEKGFQKPSAKSWENHIIFLSIGQTIC
jgi:hypothetical protein